MNFQMTITLGDIIKIATILAFGVRVLFFMRKIDNLFVQHGLMWNDFLDRNPAMKAFFKRAEVQRGQ